MHSAVPVRSRRASHARRQHGFTLLEALVATLVMAIAVVGLLSAISTSLGNASRLTEYDQISMLGKRKMEDLLAAPMPLGVPLSGQFPPSESGGLEAGWTAVAEPFEANEAGTSGGVLDRLVLEMWWRQDGVRRTLELETFRARRPLNFEEASRYPHG